MEIKTRKIGVLDETEISVLEEKMMHSSIIIAETIFVFNISFVQKCLHVLVCFRTSYIFPISCPCFLCVSARPHPCFSEFPERSQLPSIVLLFKCVHLQDIRQFAGEETNRE